MNNAQVAEILHKPILPAMISSLSDLTPEIIAQLISKSEKWHAERRTCIGGSDANRIMKGEMHQLWLEKTGRVEPKNLDDILAVVMGIITEPFNRFWFEKTTGLVVEPPCRIVHPDYPFIAANLDGICQGFVWEAKQTGEWVKDEQILQWYYPQVQHQIMCKKDTDKGIMSVFFGNRRHQPFTIDSDIPYQQQLLDREMELWRCIETDTPPEGFTPTVEVSFSDMREVDMSESNSWASLAHAWKDNKKPAKEFANAADELKALVPSDACLAYGHGVKVSRSKSGSLTIKEM